MKETLLIKNFGPIKEAYIDEVRPLTVLIGESGSGKSTVMKVLAVFQWIYKMMCIRSFLKLSGINKTPFRIVFKNLLQENGLHSYLRGDTEFEYKNGSTTLTYNGKLKGTAFLIPKDELCLEKIVFMSDKRAVINDVLEQKATLRVGMQYLFHKEAFFFVSDSNKFSAVAVAVSTFLWFKNLQLPYSKLINIMGASTFGVLLIHANSDAMRSWLWRDMVDCVGHYSLPLSQLIMYSVGVISLIFVICVFIDQFRIKLIEEPLFRWFDKKPRLRKITSQLE